MSGLTAARRSALIRPFLRQLLRTISSPSPSPSSIPPVSSSIKPSSQLTSSVFSFSSLSIPLFSPFSFAPSRSFSSDSEVPSNIVLVNSEDQLIDSLRKAIDESSPSIFYFTAEWCGPCRFLWPDIKKLSESLPDVKFYKIDIDELTSGPTIHKLDISAVPTLHFFKDGKKTAEVVGADPKKIKDVTSSLYKNSAE